MKSREIRSRPEREIKTKLKDLKMDLMKKKAQVALGAAPENPGEIRSIKRDIARIKTILQENNDEGT